MDQLLLETDLYSETLLKTDIERFIKKVVLEEFDPQIIENGFWNRLSEKVENFLVKK